MGLVPRLPSFENRHPGQVRVMDMALLTTYLEDHVAGAAAGVKLAMRIAPRNENSARAEDLIDFADRVASDEQTLLRLREKLGAAEGGALKKAIALAGEALSRIELNEATPRLTRVLEAEAMMSGVVAKRCLWVAMRRAVETNPMIAARSAEFDFDELIRGADGQIDLLRAVHHTAATVAFEASPVENH